MGRRTLFVCALAILALLPVQLLAQAPWWERARVTRSNFYLVLTDLPEEEAKELLGHMDATCASYAQLFSTLPVKVRKPAMLHLCLFADQADYADTLATVFEDDATGSWGKCITRGDQIFLVGYRGSYSVERCKPLLQHEGFHQFARHLFSGIPTWANEGLAEVFERGVIVDGGLAMGELTARDRDRLVAAIAYNQFRPLDMFFAIDSAQWSAHVVAGQSHINYLQAWSLCHFLLYGENSKYQMSFLRFLVELNRSGDQWQSAFIKSMGGVDLRVLQEKWVNHVRNFPTIDYRTVVRRLRFLSAGMRQLAADDVYPGTLEELKADLQKRNFRDSQELFGETIEFDAGDETLYQIPVPIPTPDGPLGKPQFVLVDERNRAPTRQPRQPLRIAAAGLLPGEIMVDWRKSGDEYVPLIATQPPSEALGSIAKAEQKSSLPANPASSTTETGPAAGATSTRSGFRTWTPAEGKPVEARLVTVASGKVYLKTQSGEPVKIPETDLGEADRKFVEQWRSNR